MTEKVKDELCKQFKCKDLKSMKYAVGIEVIRDKLQNSMKLKQK